MEAGELYGTIMLSLSILLLGVFLLPLFGWTDSGGGAESCCLQKKEDFWTGAAWSCCCFWAPFYSFSC